MKINLTKKDILKYSFFILIGFVLILIRYIGINHDYPFIYNSDEPALVKSAYNLRFNFLVDHFDWPHFNYYFHYFFYFSFIKFRAIVQMLPFIEVIKTNFSFFWNDFFIFYSISRFINTTFSILTAIPVYLMLELIFKRKKLALFISILFLFIPYLTVNSKFAIQEPAITFWITTGIYFLVRYLNSSKTREIFIATILFGLGMGVKYNAILFTPLVPCFLVIVLFQNGFKKNVKKWIFLNVTAGIVFLFTFIFTTFSLIPHWQFFWSYEGGVGFLWQMRDNLGTYSFGNYPNALLEDVVSFLIDSGFVFGILWLVSPLFVSRLNIERKMKLGLIVLLAFSFLYFLNASRYTISGSRFFVPIYAIVALGMMTTIIGIGKSYVKKALLITCVLIEIIFQSFIIMQYARPSTINVAYDLYSYLMQNGKKVYVKGEYLERINFLSSLKMDRLLEFKEIQTNDYLLIGRPVTDSEKEFGLVLIDTIDSKFKIFDSNYFKDRFGPPIYIYRKN